MDAYGVLSSVSHIILYSSRFIFNLYHVEGAHTVGFLEVLEVGKDLVEPCQVFIYITAEVVRVPP